MSSLVSVSSVPIVEFVLSLVIETVTLVIGTVVELRLLSRLILVVGIGEAGGGVALLVAALVTSNLTIPGLLAVLLGALEGPGVFVGFPLSGQVSVVAVVLLLLVLRSQPPVVGIDRLAAAGALVGHVVVVAGLLAARLVAAVAVARAAVVVRVVELVVGVARGQNLHGQRRGRSGHGAGGQVLLVHHRVEVDGQDGGGRQGGRQQQQLQGAQHDLATNTLTAAGPVARL
jgi:hypothetical protein